MFNLFATRYFDKSFVDSGGSVPAETAPTQITPENPMPEKPAATPVESVEPKIDDFGNLVPDDKPAPEEPAYYDSDTEFLKELGPDFDGYDSIRDALIDMAKSKRDLGGVNETLKRRGDKIESAAKMLNVSPDDLIESLSALDPRNMAATGPQWSNTDKMLDGFQFETDGQKSFFKNLANGIAQDISQQIQSQMGQAINSIYGRMDRGDFEFQMHKFLNPGDTEKAEMRSEWNGRSEELWNILANDLPHMIGKPNAIDVATRYIKAGEPPAGVKERANTLAREKLQELKAKKERLRLETPGRGPEAGKIPASLDEMDEKQLAAEIKRRQGRGERISAK